MLQNKQLSLKHLLLIFRGKILVTWALVGFENLFLALIPLLIGLAIDDLLAGGYDHLVRLASLMCILVIIAMGRRLYDTRAYGTVRVQLGQELHRRHQDLPVSAHNARLNMARELVDFLEAKVPEILTALIQILVAFSVLAFFHLQLALSAAAVSVIMIIFYSLVHTRFYQLNSGLNSQMEKQVHILETGKAMSMLSHVQNIRNWEVKLSDTEAILYGSIFILIIAFIVHNLWFSTSLSDATTGNIYSIVSYSWTYVESAIMLPFTLQSLTRLSEITDRINHNSED